MRLGGNKKIGLIVLITAIFAFIVGYSMVNGSQALAGDTKIWHDPDPAQQAGVDIRFNETMTRLVDASLPAVVSIATEQTIQFRRPGGRGFQGDRFEDFFDFFFNQPRGRKFSRQGMGSGFIINPDGYILTNNHVIEDADEITVILDDDEEFPAKVIGRDERTDVALVKINAGKNLSYLPLGDSDKLQIGHMVVAMGNPLGLSHTVTQGIVSQKGRKDINPSGRKIYANFIQTDASINPGNSGGPLLDIYGNVVGINTAIAQGQGIGFAIPVNMVKTLLPQLLTGKVERSWIGIRIQEVNNELAESLGLEKAQGALVADVVEGSPAEKAGLKAEDVILEFNGRKLKSSSDLSWFASVAGIGKKVELTIWRDRSIKKVTLKLGRMPGDLSVAQGEGSKDTLSAIGVHVTTPDTDQLKQLGISDGKGAIVTEIDPDSPALRAGLRPGDVIRKVNSKLIKNADHFVGIMKGMKKGQTVRLFVNRDRMALFIAFRI